MNTLETRINQLEKRQASQDEPLFARIAWVIENPKEAARLIGAEAVARVIELIAIARARKEKANE